MYDPWVIGYDVGSVAALFECPGYGGAGALQDADYADVWLFVRIVGGALLAAFAAVGAARLFDFPREHGVAMHGHCRVLGLDRVAVTRRVGVWYKDSGAALTEDDASADQVGVFRNAEAVFFQTGDLAPFQHLVK